MRCRVCGVRFKKGDAKHERICDDCWLIKYESEVED
jgi:hypothetical protein